MFSFKKDGWKWTLELFCCAVRHAKVKRKRVIYYRVVAVVVKWSLTGEPVLLFAWLSRRVKEGKPVPVASLLLSKPFTRVAGRRSRNVTAVYLRKHQMLFPSEHRGIKWQEMKGASPWWMQGAASSAKTAGSGAISNNIVGLALEGEGPLLLLRLWGSPEALPLQSTLK